MRAHVIRFPKEFDFRPVIEERAEGMGVGLKNAFATCYMNSVLQQLFCQPDTKALLLGSFDVPEDQCSESVLHQVKTMFAHLQYSHRQYYTPKVRFFFLSMCVCVCVCFGFC